MLFWLPRLNRQTISAAVLLGLTALLAGSANAAKPPAAPGNFTATSVDDSAISLAWIDQADRETGYQIERRPIVGGASAWVSIGPTLSSNSQSHLDSQLPENTQFDYRLRALGSSKDSSLR